MTTDLQELFDRNRAWASATEASDPGFFTRLLKQQSPQYLWIGCADSRVPANEIVDLMPGELFVHRNVANVVVHSDLNCVSVMQFAIDQLRVKHIMVVGHYGCGGVKAALKNLRVGIADNWLRHVKDVRDKHGDWLDTVEDETDRVDALCELNVLEQARNVSQSTVVHDAWLRGQELVVHGWVYGLHDGLLHDLKLLIAHPSETDTSYREAVAAVYRRYGPQAEALAPPEGSDAGDPGAIAAAATEPAVAMADFLTTPDRPSDDRLDSPDRPASEAA